MPDARFPDLSLSVSASQISSLSFPDSSLQAPTHPRGPGLCEKKQPLDRSQSFLQSFKQSFRQSFGYSRHENTVPRYDVTCTPFAQSHPTYDMRTVSTCTVHPPYSNFVLHPPPDGSEQDRADQSRISGHHSMLPSNPIEIVFFESADHFETSPSDFVLYIHSYKQIAFGPALVRARIEVSLQLLPPPTLSAPPSIFATPPPPLQERTLT